MALNPNHTFEDLGEMKCSVVEKYCTMERAIFLQTLLETNHFKVAVVKSPPPKTAIKPSPSDVSTIEASAMSETFTVGVTDLSFNPINAIYNRELKTKEGQIVTPGYWKQTDPISKEASWYWKQRPQL
jgi:hypothetical protein